MTAEEGTATADSTEADNYRLQAFECCLAMKLVCSHGWPQATAILAMQAVRSAANALLAAYAGVSATGEGADPIVLLYRHVRRFRTEPALAWGAEVLALEEDLGYYGMKLSRDETRRIVTLAEAFCDWSKVT